MSKASALRSHRALRLLTALGTLWLLPASVLAQPEPAEGSRETDAAPPAAPAPSAPATPSAPDAPSEDASAPNAPPPAEEPTPAPDDSEPAGAASADASSPPSEAPAAQPNEPAAEPAPQPPAAPSTSIDPPSAPPASTEVDVAAANASPEAEVEQEVTVAGTRIAQVAGSAHVIKGRQLERFSYDDPNSVLVQVPGVYVRAEDGMGLRPNIGIRGVNPDRSKKLTLMEDGVLFGPAPYSAPAAYYFPLMSRMTQVRVIKGPGAVAFGPQTVGGAIDFGTRAIPSTTSGSLAVGAGQFGYAKAHGYFGTSDEQTGFLVEGVHLHDDGFKTLPNDADTGSTRNEWMVKGSYVIDPRAENLNTLGLKLTYSDEVSNETYLGLSEDDFRDDPYQRYAASALDQMKNHRTSIVLSHQLEVPSYDLVLQTKAYRHDYKRAWRKVNQFRGTKIGPVLENPDSPTSASYYAVLKGESDSASLAEALLIGPNDRTFVSQGVQTVAQLKAQTGPLSHSVEAGVRLHNDSIKRRHSENGFLMIGGQLIPDGTAETVTAANFEETYALAVHATDAMTWRALTFTPGVRTELIRSEREDFLSGAEGDRSVVAVMPGAGLFVAITDYLGALAGVYRGFSPPPVASHERVEPEYSVNYEAGLRARTGAARGEVIGFYNDYSNLTISCTLAAGCDPDDIDTQFDAGEARIYGFEASAEHELRVGSLKFPFLAAYTYTRAEFRSAFKAEDVIYGEVEKGDELPYVPRHQVNASLGVETDRAGGIVGLNYVSATREQPGTEPLDEVMSTDSQLWLDASARYRVYGPLSVSVNVRNVLGSQYVVSHRPYGARPNAPRLVQIGAKLDF